jgi:post-segregation antitoxin (ccd killing protein)
MSKKMSTCLYIDKSILETAKRVGLKVSRVAENALVEAVGRLTGTKTATGADGRPVGMEWDGSPGDTVR